MRVHGHICRVLFIGLLSSSICYGSAIVAGFDTVQDGRNDDGTYTAPSGCSNPFDGGTCPGTLVPVGFTFDFFGIVTNSVYINTNGNVTLDSPLFSPIPFDLSLGFNEIIAPFFADVDTRDPSSGVMTFGNGQFDGHNAFGVDWINVGYFSHATDKQNSFQLLLVDRSDIGPGDFDLIFNYDKVQWETGDSGFGDDGLGGISAVAGFSDGTGNPDTTVQLDGSGVPGSFIDGGTNALISNDLNSDVLGRYIFGFRDGNYVVTPEPSSALLSLIPGMFILLGRRFRAAKKR